MSIEGQTGNRRESREGEIKPEDKVSEKDAGSRWSR